MRLTNGEVLLSWPLEFHVVTAGYRYKDGGQHNAIDLRCTVGTPVYAAEDGQVSMTFKWNGKVTKGDTNSYGNMVKIRHADYNHYSLETLYAHLDRFVVNCGDYVKEGQLIGYSGCTGNCQGAHLHFEVRWMGKRFNPLCWLDDSFVPADSKVYLFAIGEHSVVRPKKEPQKYSYIRIHATGQDLQDCIKFCEDFPKGKLSYELLN